jgi:hypothetical protein
LQWVKILLFALKQEKWIMQYKKMPWASND